MSLFSRSSQRPNQDDVVALYKVFVGYPPENKSAIEYYVQAGSLKETIRRFAESSEFRSRLTQDPLGLGLYASPLNAESLVLRHEHKDRVAVPGHMVNYLGVATDVGYVGAFAHLSGVVEAPPIPCNNHAELVEWAAVLRAVELASDRFTVVELGAGWGCWMVNSAVAAKRLGLDVLAIGVEGDEGHASNIADHCAKNGITSEEFRVEIAVAGASEGVALFPVVGNSADSYGQEPRFFATQDDADAFLRSTSARYDAMPIRTLDDISASAKTIDLLHIDIQGGEVEFLRSSQETLKRKVAYIVVGTHSRKIDGDLIELMQSHGWRLEFEKPCTIQIDGAGNVLNIRDGTQGWANTNLRR